MVYCEPGLFVVLLVGVLCFIGGIFVGVPLLQYFRCSPKRLSTTRGGSRTEADYQVTTSPDLQQEARAQVALLRASRSSQ